MEFISELWHNTELFVDKSLPMWTLRQTNNSSPPGHIGCHFADDIFRCIFVNEKFCILIKNSLKFILKSPIDNNPELV